MVVGSKLLKHQQKYRVFVTSQDFDEPQTLEIAIRHLNSLSENCTRILLNSQFPGWADVAQNVALVNGTTQIIEFDVSSINFLLIDLNVIWYLAQKSTNTRLQSGSKISQWTNF